MTSVVAIIAPTSCLVYSPQATSHSDRRGDNRRVYSPCVFTALLSETLAISEL